MKSCSHRIILVIVDHASEAPSVWSPTLVSPSASDLSPTSSGSLPITFSNCDHSASTDENSLPTCRSQSVKAPLLTSHLTPPQAKKNDKTKKEKIYSYRNNSLQRPVQLVDVC